MREFLYKVLAWLGHFFKQRLGSKQTTLLQTQSDYITTHANSVKVVRLCLIALTEVT